MRKRIQQLANGKFEYAKTLLQFSTDKISIEALEGKDVSGEFVITGDRHTMIRGVVYTSDYRMECLNPQFEGEEVRIRYQFHTDGMTEGDIQKGDFYIVSDQGEYNLPFVVYITGLYADTSEGQIRSLDDFALLASKNFNEARQLFTSRYFKNILKREEPSVLRAYEALDKNINPGQKLEEFLIFTRRKKPVSVTLDTPEKSYYEVAETFADEVVLRRENWGYIDINVTSDAGFLVPDKKHISDEDFIGSTHRFRYEICEDKMHPGKNYARLTFRMPLYEITVDVVASRGSDRRSEIGVLQRRVREARLQLTSLYLDYRQGKIVTGVWAGQTAALCDRLVSIGINVSFYTLVKAQALIVNRQKQEAMWLLDDFRHNWANHNAPLWGYYLYICTLAEREQSYIDKVTEEIEELYRRNPFDPLLFWVRLLVREEYYRNPGRRLRDLEQWMSSEGNASPIFYIEAYYLIEQDPYYISRFTSFEVRVLYWAAGQHIITKDVAAQAVHAAAQVRVYNRFIYRILCECYSVDDSDDTLSVIISYLIRGQRFEREYHHWYARGIERELRITSLYEAYLISLDEREIATVPRMIQMYFQYTSSIAWEKRAILYVNIIANKDSDPALYHKYRPVIEQFAAEQLEACHISDDLAVIYDDVVRNAEIDEGLSYRLSRVLFSHKIVCRDANMAKVIVTEDSMAKPQAVIVSDQTGYFSVYSNDYTVILEDAYGNQYLSTEKYTDDALMKPARYIDRCVPVSNKNVSYSLYLLRKKHSADDFCDADMVHLTTVMNARSVSDKYKASLFEHILRFYRVRGIGNLFDESGIETLMDGANRLPLDGAGKCELVLFLAGVGRYEEALLCARNYGHELIAHITEQETEQYGALCTYAIEAYRYEEDDFIIEMTQRLYFLGFINEAIVEYLCRHYNSSTKNMAKVWNVARDTGVDRHDLGERIITQMLYTDEYVYDSESIYEDYCFGGWSERICMAYISRAAHGYLTSDENVPKLVFRQIESRYTEGRELNDACRFALLKYYSSFEILDDGKGAIAEELLDHYVSRNIYFRFFLDFEARLLEKFYLYDKAFVECHTTPHIRVVIHYRRCDGEEYATEELTEMYPGIYVREFIMFCDETIQYYMSEEDGESVNIIESAMISMGDWIFTDKKPEHMGRFDRINEIIRLDMVGDKESADEAMRRYAVTDHIVGEAFRLL